MLFVSTSVTEFFADTWPGSFLFYNTHSLPVRGEDTRIPLLGGPPLRRRELAPSFGFDFGFDYSDFNHSNVSFRRRDSYASNPLRVYRSKITNCRTSGLRRPSSPTAAMSSWLRLRNSQSRFAATVATGSSTVRVFCERVRSRRCCEPQRLRNRSFGVMAARSVQISANRIPHPIRRFVTQDAWVPGVGTTRNVKYGDRYIGPSGAISESNTEG